MQKIRRERTHSKKVKFSISNNEEFFFCKHDAVNVQRVLIDPEVNGNQTSEVPTKHTLVNAFCNRTCSDVIQALEAHKVFEAQPKENFDLESVLQMEYTSVGNQLKDINDFNKNAEKQAERNDLSAKYRVLSIYINCIHLIEQTMSLKKWYALEIELKYIDLKQNHDNIDAVGGNVAVKLHNGNIKENFGPIPVKKFAQHISYNNEHLVYSVHNNRNFPFEQRDFIIDLIKGSTQDPIANGRKVGSFCLQLNDIEERCLPDGLPSEFTQLLSNITSQEITNGFVTITARKRSADKEYVLLKKQEVIKRLKLQLEYIERFNKDPKTPSGVRLTANISGAGGTSILHAAIVLMDDKDLVEKMLKLGANPRSSIDTGIGTPLSLAQRNFHRAAEKEKNTKRRIEEKKHHAVDIGPHVYRCNQARALVEILQKNVIKPLSSTAFTEEFPSETVTENPQERSKSSLMSPMIETNSQSGTLYLSESADFRPPFNTSSRDQFDTKKIQNPCDSSCMKHPTKRSSDTREEKKQQSLSGAQNSSSVAKPAMPVLKLRDWIVVTKQGYKMCHHGPHCYHFKRKSCRFWHVLLAPLPHERIPIASHLLPALDKLPKLIESQVVYKKQATSKAWWTAAYLDQSMRMVIYAQKIQEFVGHLNDSGIAWFLSKKSAYQALQCTVFLFRDKGNDNHLNHNQNHSSRQPKAIISGIHSQHQSYGNHHHYRQGSPRNANRSDNLHNDNFRENQIHHRQKEPMGKNSNHQYRQNSYPSRWE